MPRYNENNEKHRIAYERSSASDFRDEYGSLVLLSTPISYCKLCDAEGIYQGVPCIQCHGVGFAHRKRPDPSPSKFYDKYYYEDTSWDW